jgi:hypothetical protein
MKVGDLFGLVWEDLYPLVMGRTLDEILPGLGLVFDYGWDGLMDMSAGYRMLFGIRLWDTTRAASRVTVYDEDPITVSAPSGGAVFVPGVTLR